MSRTQLGPPHSDQLDMKHSIQTVVTDLFGTRRVISKGTRKVDAVHYNSIGLNVVTQQVRCDEGQVITDAGRARFQRIRLIRINTDYSTPSQLEDLHDLLPHHFSHSSHSSQHWSVRRGKLTKMSSSYRTNKYFKQIVSLSTCTHDVLRPQLTQWKL